MNASLIRCSLGAALLLSLAACEPAPPAAAGPARFDGVLASNWASIVTSPSRCAISFLYDRFSLEWRPAEPPGKDEKAVAGRFELAVTPASSGQRILLDLRGHYSSSDGSRVGAAAAEVAGRKLEIPLPDGTETNEVYHRIEAVVPNGAASLPVSLEAKLRRPAAGDAQLTIDSIDVAMVSAAGCKSIEDEKASMPSHERTGAPADPKRPAGSPRG